MGWPRYSGVANKSFKPKTKPLQLCAGESVTKNELKRCIKYGNLKRCNC